jgi:hypothetical protein
MGGSAPSIDYGQILQDEETLLGQQQTYDLANYETQQAANNAPQVTPFGELQYIQTGIGPNGVPIYTGETTYSPQQQYLLDIGQGTQGQAATQANELLTGAQYGSTNPVTDIGNMSSGLNGQQMGAFLQGEEPFFNYQTEALQSQLANQGLTPGTPAYDQAMNTLRQNQGQTVSSAEAQFQPTAFGEAQSLYNQPLSTAENLYQVGAPGSLTQSMINTPQNAIQVPNTSSAYSAAAGPVEAQAQLQEQQYGSSMAGLGQIGGAAIGLLSDEKAKKDIVPIGKTKSGIPVVHFKYKHDDSEHVGVLSKDVKQVHPDCVHHVDGWDYVDYDELGRREAA